MSKITKKNWKQTAVEVYVNTPRKNGRVQWKLIIEGIEKVHKNAFKGVKNPSKKLQDMFRTATIKDAVHNLEVAATKLTTPKASKATTKIALAATSAHVNDEDKDTEEENEVVSTEIVEEKTNKDGTVTKTVDLLTLAEVENLSSERIMEILGYDPKYFTLVSSSCRRGAWEMIKKDEEEPVELHSYRLNANVRPIGPGEVSIEMMKDSLRKLIEGERLLSAEKEKLEVVGDRIAILSIADLHLGKLAWAPECGENYDYKIAIKKFNHIVNSAIERLHREEGIEKIIFFWCQDFFHFDKTDITTTAGTRQDTDVRWQKMFDFGTRMLVEAIEKLSEIAPVQTFYVRSNHDSQTSYYATSYLSAWFHNNPNVEIDASASPRKYVKYGVNLLGFGHGDKEGKRMAHLMSIERPQDWGTTTNHEFFLGHFHSLRTYEEAGVILRYLSSPTGTDAWHCESGFIGAQKAAQMFIRGKHEGQIAEYVINVQ